MGEFIGTLILVLLGDGVCATVNLSKSEAQAPGWIVIAFGWRLAITMAVYTSGFVGSAHLDPAISLAMVMTGAISWDLVTPLIIAQVLGAFARAILAWLSYLSHQGATKDESAVSGIFVAGPAIWSYPANMITGLVGTPILVLGLLAFGQDEFTPETNVFVAGGLILAIGLSLGGSIGYTINPARDSGPQLAHVILSVANKGTSDQAHLWVPIAGPIIGVIIAVGVYSLAM